MALHKAIHNEKNLFWEALVITIAVFIIGLVFGVIIENNRTESIKSTYSDFEESLLDIQAQTELLNLDIGCDIAIKNNIDFGNSIYEQALKLEKYEDSRILTDTLLSQHRKYSLLRTLFFTNSLKIRDSCNNRFEVVTYVYDLEPKNIEEQAFQKTVSNKLLELKNQYGDNMILIPIAGDLDLKAVNIIKENYNISSLAVILNEDRVLLSLADLKQLEDYLADKYN